MNPGTVFNDWAAAWNISQDAVRDYYKRLAVPVPHPAPDLSEGASESAVQAHMRLAAAREGNYLWRNNVGAAMTDTGSFIRYGLANDSKKLNEVLKSSDLIGIRSVAITPSHVGSVIGQFYAREVKHAGWKYTGTDREKAQLRFIELVNGKGGDAGFVTA